MQTRKLVSFFLIVFLVLAFIPLRVKADMATFGYENGGVHGASTRTWTGFTCSGKFNLPVDGDVSSISVWLGQQWAYTTHCAIYLDSDKSKVVTSEQIVTDNDGGHKLYTMNIAPAQHLTAADYWLAVHQSVSGDYYYDAGGTEWLDNADLPATIDGDTVKNTDKMSIYATYTPSGGGQDLTFGLVENLFPSGTMFFGKEISYLQTNSIYPSANLLFNKELALWKYDNLFTSATSTMTKAVKLTLFELFDFVKLHASNVMLPGWTALTIEIAVAIGVLALVLAICGISLVVLRRRRE